jgi:hypothetical protein
MSHFTTLKTQIVSRDHLLAALEDLGIEFETGQLEIAGYGGIRTQVEIRIPSTNPAYQIGFRRQGERYELVADWYGIKDINRETFLGRVTQRYAYRVTKEQLERQEFTVVEEEVRSDGTIHVTVRRMA